MKGERRSFRFSAERSTVEVLFGESQEFSREQVVVLRFVDAAPGIWKITVNSDFDAPNFHAWLPIQNFLPQDVIFLDSNPDLPMIRCQRACMPPVEGDSHPLASLSRRLWHRELI